MTPLQEYDLEFKPVTIIKGQVLCKLMPEIQDNEDDDWENEAELHMIDMCPIFIAPESWYTISRKGIFLNTGISNK